MRKCAYCGKEYPDSETHCHIDGEPLAGGEQEIPPAPTPVSSAPVSNLAIAAPAAFWTDGRLRIFEIVLVCLVAFGGSLLASTYYLYNLGAANPSMSRQASVALGGSWLKWLNSGIHETVTLGLLWYVLRRRSRTWSDLGFGWSRKDFGWSMILWVGGCIAFYAVYFAIYSTKLTGIAESMANDRVGRTLFGGGVSLVTLLFQFLNPFYEELIVRAYLMTEVRQLTGSITKAVILSTALQTSYHFYQGAPLAFSDGAVFLIYSLSYAKTGRITPVILAHLYTDVLGTLWYYFHH